ncbi:MAG: hypothetical protein COB85_06865 [Bacteroidetes bacterium]|nr:MAG: hypothetical protein COB85_06865 [Bacteroidota bacterium]
MKKLLLLTAVVAMVFQGCETDFDVNAPWKDVAVVYGVLDQSDSTHFIKINKAFLGEVDVYTLAQIRDSSEYDPADIDVTIEERDEIGTVINVWPVKYLTDSKKVGGTFYAPDQTLYYFDNILDPSMDYKLVINNNKSGKVVSAITPLVSDFSFQPASYWQNTSQVKVGFYKDNNYQVFSRAKWLTAENGRRYQLTLRFHYREVRLGVPNPDTLDLHIDWQFGSITSVKLSGGQEIGVDIKGEDFYQFVANNIEPASVNNVERYIGTLDFIVDVGGEDLHTYIEVNEPSTGIVQERPEYSNITDANGNYEIGIFSCRHTVSKIGASLSTSGNPYNSKTELCSGQYTYLLGFVNPGTCN